MEKKSKSTRAARRPPSSHPVKKQRNLKLTLEYVGSGFFGFQRQPKHVTIQETLEDALSKIFNRKTRIAGASGRTDTGVHAAMQVVHVKTDNAMTLEKMLMALNGVLPKKIAVIAIEEMAADFHARFSARYKVYEYRVWNHAVRSPLRGAGSFHVSQRLSVPRMRKAAVLLKGRNDFRSFCSAGGLKTERVKGEKDTVRTLKEVTIRRTGNLIVFRFGANGFLHHMVRNMVGTLLEVGRGRLEPESLKEIIKARDRRKAAGAVPGNGLTLLEVRY